jgi:hypothetical protein
MNLNRSAALQDYPLQATVTDTLIVASSSKTRGASILCTYSYSRNNYVNDLMKFIQSLTIVIMFELFYYINGYFRVHLTSMNIHQKCHAYLLY